MFEWDCRLLHSDVKGHVDKCTPLDGLCGYTLFSNPWFLFLFSILIPLEISSFTVICARFQFFAQGCISDLYTTNSRLTSKEY